VVPMAWAGEVGPRDDSQERIRDAETTRESLILKGFIHPGVDLSAGMGSGRNGECYPLLPTHNSEEPVHLAGGIGPSAAKPKFLGRGERSPFP